MAAWDQTSEITALTSHQFHTLSSHRPVTDSYGRREEGRNISSPRLESGLSMRCVCLGWRNLLHLCTYHHELCAHIGLGWE